jgi:sulfite exporter TauE/SafE
MRFSAIEQAASSSIGLDAACSLNQYNILTLLHLFIESKLSEKLKHSKNYKWNRRGTLAVLKITWIFIVV